MNEKGSVSKRHQLNTWKAAGVIAAIVVICVAGLFVSQYNGTGYSKEAAVAIDDFVKKYGKDSPDYNHSAYVVTDFDNTTSIFDITYQYVQYHLETMSFARDPAGLKTALSTELDMENAKNNQWISDICTAYSHLYDKYGPFRAKGLNRTFGGLYGFKRGLQFLYGICLNENGDLL